MKINTIRNIDQEIWRKFVACCKLKGTNVGEELSALLDEYNKKNLKNLLK